MKSKHSVQVQMGCKQKEACLTQRGNNDYDCSMNGNVKTCRQCCNSYNCAAKNYFRILTDDHQTRTLGASIDAPVPQSLTGTFWFDDLMVVDEK